MCITISAGGTPVTSAAIFLSLDGSCVLWKLPWSQPLFSKFHTISYAWCERLYLLWKPLYASYVPSGLVWCGLWPINAVAVMQVKVSRMTLACPWIHGSCAHSDQVRVLWELHGCLVWKGWAGALFYWLVRGDSYNHIRARLSLLVDACLKSLFYTSYVPSGLFYGRLNVGWDFYFFCVWMRMF